MMILLVFVGADLFEILAYIIKFSVVIHSSLWSSCITAGIAFKLQPGVVYTHL